MGRLARVVGEVLMMICGVVLGIWGSRSPTSTFDYSDPLFIIGVLFVIAAVIALYFERQPDDAAQIVSQEGQGHAATVIGRDQVVNNYYNADDSERREIRDDLQRFVDEIREVREQLKAAHDALVIEGATPALSEQRALAAQAGIHQRLESFLFERLGHADKQSIMSDPEPVEEPRIRLKGRSPYRGIWNDLTRKQDRLTTLIERLAR